MKRTLLATTAPIVFGALYFGTLQPTSAALLSLGPPGCAASVCEGITYTLESQATADPLTEQFALLITGENSASDTIKGRTGINAVSFNLVSHNPDSPNAGTMVGSLINGVLTKPDTRFVFQMGGLNSGGCDGSGNFFCFNNITIGDSGAAPQPPASPLITGPVVLGFEVTLLPGGSWSNYSTALKIDWVGSQHNYSLVSADIPVNTTCPDCIINPVIVPTPEPSSLALLGLGLAGTLAFAGRRQRRV